MTNTAALDTHYAVTAGPDLSALCEQFSCFSLRVTKDWSRVNCPVCLEQQHSNGKQA